jgi:hypothetical protein
MNKKSKPDYTKFMRKPTPFRLSAPDQELEQSERKADRSEKIPEAEILLTPEQQLLLKRQEGNRQAPTRPDLIPDAEIVFSPDPPIGVSPAVTVTDASWKPMPDAELREEDLDYVPVVEAPPLAAMILVVLALVALLL